jgi:hypothetical protein
MRRTTAPWTGGPLTRPALAVGVLLTISAALATPAHARKPVLGSTAVVEAVSGTVKVKKLGSDRYRKLTERTTIKLGATVDARHGKVKLVTASNNRGGTQAGLFYDGAFVVTQKREAQAVTELKLAKGSFASCPKPGTAAAHSAAARRTVRKLWGSGHGRFRTRGRYAAATVRGTTWLMEDFCDTSKTTSVGGTVLAGVNERGTFTKRILKGAEFKLEEGQSFEIYCAEYKPVADVYCVSVLSQPADNLFGMSILLLNTPLTDYRLCITGPTGQDCGTFALTPPDSDNFRSSAVACFPGRGPGTYTVTWNLAGVVVPVPIRFASTQGQQELSCLSAP